MTTILVTIAMFLAISTITTAAVCIGLALFTEDAAGATGYIEEGQIW